MTDPPPLPESALPPSAPRLPPVADAAEADAVARDEGRLGPGVAEICRRHGLAGLPRRRFPRGSVPVYEIGEHRVLKLFPPLDGEHCATERRVLERLAGLPALPTPRVDAAGELDGWTYLLMERLPGHALADLWEVLAARDREELAAQVGRGLAALHAVSGEGLELAPAWSAFLAGQRADCVARQRARGLAEGWLEQIPAFLARYAPQPEASLHLLHTEVMREHLLAAPTADGWRLTGLVDFEPAMLGAADYEFASVGVFVTCGDAGLLRRVLLAYGHRAADLDAGMACRFLACALVHRYSNLPWYLRRLPPPAGVETLERLAAYWYGAEDGI